MARMFNSMGEPPGTGGDRLTTGLPSFHLIKDEGIEAMFAKFTSQAREMGQQVREAEITRTLLQKGAQYGATVADGPVAGVMAGMAVDHVLKKEEDSGPSMR